MYFKQEKCIIYSGRVERGYRQGRESEEDMTMDLNEKKSLYNWNSNKNGLQVSDNQLAMVEELSTPLTYYSAGTAYNSLKIAYISDIHLNHHLKYYDNNAKRMVRDISHKLYQLKGNADIVFLWGCFIEPRYGNIAFYTI